MPSCSPRARPTGDSIDCSSRRWSPLGVSDGPYFEWLAHALRTFERASGELSAIGAGDRPADLWVLAGARMSPGLEVVRDALGTARTRVTFLDRFERGPD